MKSECLLEPLRIGNVQLESPVLSAPVAGFTDIVFRSMLRAYGGCGLIYTEMVSAGGWIDGGVHPRRLLGVELEQKPLGVQLWDREARRIEEAASKLIDLGVSVIDLNFGCPKKRIMGKQAAGAQLLRDPATVGELVAAAVKGAKGTPVTAKIRLGASTTDCSSVAVARSAEDNGAAAVTVHGRFADNNYSIPCNFELIGEVVQAVNVPVIANGDIRDVPSALQAIKSSGASGVMVARAALSRPWLFREITAALQGQEIPKAPTLAEQQQQLLDHYQAVINIHGEQQGTILMRKYACRYLSGVPGARQFRNAVTAVSTSDEFRLCLQENFPTEE